MNKYLCSLEKRKTAIKNGVREFSYHRIKCINPKINLENLEQLIKVLIFKQQYESIKYQLELNVEFTKETPSESKTISNWFNSGQFFGVAQNNAFSKGRVA